ncbi:MAG: universal stress protein [Myxococcales bacterium]|nr:universal stress protein [Myxococcales bacterium]
MFPKILVATDFSPASRPALETAAKLQVALDAQVTLLHVYVVVTPLWGERQRELSVIDADLRGALEERHAKMFERPFEVALMESDNAALAITDYAADHGFDLIVTSTHGRTGLKRALLGSVAENTVRHAPCPVWTARA